MRHWRTRRIALAWVGWTALLGIAAYAYSQSNFFAPVNVTLPLPISVGVNGHRFSATAAMIAAVVWLFLFLYMPPILLTLSWLVARRRRDA